MTLKLSKDSAILLLRDHVRHLLGDVIDRGHMHTCTAAGSDDPLDPRCGCGQMEMVHDALDALRKTSKRGTHHYSMLMDSPACAKCGGERGVDVGPVCPSEEGLET